MRFFTCLKQSLLQLHLCFFSEGAVPSTTEFWEGGGKVKINSKESVCEKVPQRRIDKCRSCLSMLKGIGKREKL